MTVITDSQSSQTHRLAVIFPGQGSQTVGMMTELSQTYPCVQKTFEEASDAVGFDIWAVCQDEDKLSQTEFTQPALLTASLAVWRILQENIFHQHTPLYLAGHSLGEYSALCAAGVLSLSDAARLVYQRGQFMQEAVSGIDTMMAAVLGLDNQQVITLCEQVTEYEAQAIVQAANFNSPGQIVVAGNRLGVETLIKQIQNIGKKAIPLKVSVPSHCALMKPACDALADALSNIHFNLPSIPVIQNRHAQVSNNPQTIKQALIEQLSEPVLWTQTMELLSAKHVTDLIECGHGNVLSNLAKRQQTPICSHPVDKPEKLEKLISLLNS